MSAYLSLCVLGGVDAISVAVPDMSGGSAGSLNCFLGCIGDLGKVGSIAREFDGFCYTEAAFIFGSGLRSQIL